MEKEEEEEEGGEDTGTGSARSWVLFSSRFRAFRTCRRWKLRIVAAPNAAWEVAGGGGGAVG